MDIEFDSPCEPGSDEWHRRLAVFMADTDEGWWWLSFVDRDCSVPFLGLCIVPGGNIVQAVQYAHFLGCNPGGEVAGYPMQGTPRDQYVGRLFEGDKAKEIADLGPQEIYEGWAS